MLVFMISLNLNPVLVQLAKLAKLVQLAQTDKFTGIRTSPCKMMSNDTLGGVPMDT